MRKCRHIRYDLESGKPRCGVQWCHGLYYYGPVLCTYSEKDEKDCSEFDSIYDKEYKGLESFNLGIPRLDRGFLK